MKKTEVQVQVAAEDVDDVVEIALRMMQDDEDTLSLETLREVGEDLDIPAEYIDRARQQLETERAKAKRASERRGQRAVKLRLALISSAVALFAVALVWGSVSLSAIGAVHAAAEAQRAQVENVKQRKDAVVELYRGRPDSPDKDAELIGAENRIRVESKRYAELAARYNARANSFPVSLFLVVSDLPASIPTTLN